MDRCSITGGIHHHDKYGVACSVQLVVVGDGSVKEASANGGWVASTTIHGSTRERTAGEDDTNAPIFTLQGRW